MTASIPALYRKNYLLKQVRIKSDKTKASLELKNPLAGLLVCAKCGYAMVYCGYTHLKNVAPRVNHRPSQNCKVKSATLTDIMNAFVHGLKLSLEDFQIKIDNASIVDENDIQKQISSLEKEKKKIERLLAKIFDDYENEIYTANEFVQRKAKHNARLEIIEKEIAELETTIPERTEYEEKIMSLYEALDLLKDNSIDAGVKNEYLKSFIDKVEYSRDNNEEFILDIYFK